MKKVLLQSQNEDLEGIKPFCFKHICSSVSAKLHNGFIVAPRQSLTSRNCCVLCYCRFSCQRLKLLLWPQLPAPLLLLLPACMLEASCPCIYVAAPGSGITSRQLRTAMAAIVPPYMVPAYFTAVDSIPLNAHGKIDRSALPAPVTVAVAPASGGEAISDELEAAVAAAMELSWALPLAVSDQQTALCTTWVPIPSACLFCCLNCASWQQTLT